MSKPIFLNEKKNSDTVEVNIIGRIGSSMFEEGYTKEDAKNDILKNKDKNIVVNLFTGGGSAYDGLFIHDLLAMHPKDTTVNILGMAASAGSIIALGAKKIRMSKNASLMIHEPMFGGGVTPSTIDGVKEEMEQLYGIMLNIYQSKTGINEPELREMMNNKDKWFTAEEALKLNFIDEIFTPMAIAAELQSKAETGEFINEIIKTNIIDMEFQQKYDQLSVEFNTLQNELETMKASYDAMEAVKASFEAKVEEVTNELNSVKTENEDLKAQIALATEKSIIDFVNSAVKSGKITEPLKDQYLKLAKQDFETVKAILDVAPERVSIVNTLIDNSKTDIQVLNELIKGKENWDEIDFLGKDAETLEKIKNYHPEYYSMIHKKAYPNV
jgi:ATP-dependent protease ClpP protease subunit